MRHTRLAVFVFLFVLCFPWRISVGFGFFSTFSILDPVLIVLLGLLILAAFTRGKASVGDVRTFGVLSLPVFFAILSLFWTVNEAATTKSVVVYGAALATFLITVTLFRGVSLREMARLILMIPIILLVTAVTSYIPSSPLRPEVAMPSQAVAHGGFLLSYYARFSHPFLGLSNSFATILAMFLPLVLMIRRLGLWPKLARWVAILTFGAIIATGSRGVLLAVAVGFGLTLMWRVISAWNIPRGVCGGVLLSLTLAGTFVWFNPEAWQHLSGRLSVGNVAVRLHAFAGVFDVLWQLPLGVGSGVSLREVSEVSIRSVHNAYLQNMLWFGWLGGSVLTFAMLALPLVILVVPVVTVAGLEARRGLALSVLILLLINLSQASWEGSVVRVWIYFLIALGVVVARRAGRVGTVSARG